jgi:hypothetical protein
MEEGVRLPLGILHSVLRSEAELAISRHRDSSRLQKQKNGGFL